MADLKVTYFDFSGSRGEEVRLALAIAGADFEDNRLARGRFNETRGDYPFGSLPVLDIAGHGVFAHSNAILRLIGRLYGMYPDDVYEAARHDGLLEACEEFRHRAGATRNDDMDKRMAARAEFASGFLPRWAQGVERVLGSGPFAGGAKPGVADVKLYIIHQFISGGTLDGVPVESFAPFGKFGAVAAGVAAHPAVVAWQAKHA